MKTQTILLIILPFLLLLTACTAADSNTGTPYSEDEAMEILCEAISMAEDTAVVSYGQEEIDGDMCWTFAYGKNTPEKFTAEEYYAVTSDGAILKLDISDGQYKQI